MARASVILVLSFLSLGMTAAKRSLIRSRSLQEEEIPCTSCINRRQKRIKAFYHGHESDPFWQPIVAAAERAGEDHGVTLETKLYRQNLEQMVADIRLVIEQQSADALILSIPAEIVRDAAFDATRAGIPVFGVNVGYENQYDTMLQMGAFIGQDDYQAGTLAAQRFLESRSVVNKAIFVSHEARNTGQHDRFAGFRDAIQVVNPSASVEKVIVDVSNPFSVSTMDRELNAILETCDMDVVLSGGAWPATPTLELVQRWNSECNSSNSNTEPTLFGTFDTTGEIVSAIESGDILFAVSQQSHLQAVVPVTLASLYLTTGKVPADEKTNLASGPIIVDANKNLPDNQEQACADRGYSGAGCMRREQIRIGAVFDVHTNTRSGSAWNTLVTTTKQAADDMGVFFGIFEASGDMSAKIKSICEDGIVEGLFLYIDPSSTSNLGVAVDYCASQGIQVVGAEADPSQSLDFHNSVGLFQPDLSDMPRTYFQGYLPIALLTYYIESKQNFLDGSRLEPGSDTPSLSLMSMACAETSFRICDGGDFDSIGVVPASPTLDVEAVDPPTSPFITTNVDARSAIDLILVVLFVVLGLAALIGITYFSSILVTSVLRKFRSDPDEEDDATVSMYDEEDEEDEDFHKDTPTDIEDSARTDSTTQVVEWVEDSARTMDTPTDIEDSARVESQGTDL